jgi:hypothetical protein
MRRLYRVSMGIRVKTGITSKQDEGEYVDDDDTGCERENREGGGVTRTSAGRRSPLLATPSTVARDPVKFKLHILLRNTTISTSKLDVSQMLPTLPARAYSKSSNLSLSPRESSGSPSPHYWRHARSTLQPSVVGNRHPGSQGPVSRSGTHQTYPERP